MRNTSKMTTLENRFPLLAVEHGCIISKDADITVAFEVELPELYTVTGAEYEAIHSCWCKAIKVLPDYSVVHKQDWFIKERYKPELQKDDMSFLSRSFNLPTALLCGSFLLVYGFNFSGCVVVCRHEIFGTDVLRVTEVLTEFFEHTQIVAPH